MKCPRCKGSDRTKQGPNTYLCTTILTITDHVPTGAVGRMTITEIQTYTRSCGFIYQDDFEQLNGAKCFWSDCARDAVSFCFECSEPACDIHGHSDRRFMCLAHWRAAKDANRRAGLASRVVADVDPRQVRQQAERDLLASDERIHNDPAIIERAGALATMLINEYPLAARPLVDRVTILPGKDSPDERYAFAVVDRVWPIGTIQTLGKRFDIDFDRRFDSALGNRTPKTKDKDSRLFVNSCGRVVGLAMGAFEPSVEFEATMRTKYDPDPDVLFWAERELEEVRLERRKRAGNEPHWHVLWRQELVYLLEADLANPRPQWNTPAPELPFIGRPMTQREIDQASKICDKLRALGSAENRAMEKKKEKLRAKLAVLAGRDDINPWQHSWPALSTSVAANARYHQKLREKSTSAGRDNILHQPR